MKRLPMRSKSRPIDASPSAVRNHYQHADFDGPTPSAGVADDQRQIGPDVAKRAGEFVAIKANPALAHGCRV
jgi:hypothetical protein